MTKKATKKAVAKVKVTAKKATTKEVKATTEVKAKVEVNPVIDKAVLFKSFAPKKEGKSMLGAIVAGMKETILKAGGGTRKLSPEGRKSRALQALTDAMLRRQWTKGSDGVYNLNSVTVDTKTKDFSVVVNDGQAKYSLALGKGAIRELDSYMRLR